MHIAITSRIFAPEPSAASFRLAALAEELSARKHEVTVLTVRPSKHSFSETAKTGVKPYRIIRFPVLRDRNGYVRGYMQYMSFDILLFFRILFGPKRDLIVSEPPPTTGFFVRCAAALRRTPYAYYAADIWSEASVQTSAPQWVLRAVRSIEQTALRGASIILAVSPEVASRVAAFGVRGQVKIVGNGVDVGAFRSGIDPFSFNNAETSNPEFIYAGTASEWHGAGVFIDALPELLHVEPRSRLRFIGGGSEIDALRVRARQLGVSHAVTFAPTLPPEQLAPLLRGATAALASVRPDSSYEFAFPTKLYSAVACGAPIIYSGGGPTREFVATEVAGAPLGLSVDASAEAVAKAMIACASETFSESRRRAVSEWAEGNVSVKSVAERAAAFLEESTSS